MMQKKRWLRLISGAAALLLVLTAVAWVVTPDLTTPRPRAGTLSTAGAAQGLSRVSQAADEKPVGDGPIVIQPDHMDVSPPLRDIEPVVATPEEEALIRFREIGLLPGHAVEGSFGGVDATLQDWHGPLAAMPSPIQNWDGINNVGYTIRPPDTQGDVGLNHYVQWVNLRFQIWNKTGTSLYGPALGNTLWSGFGGQCQTTNDGDPITLYDHLADRWVMMQFAVTSTPNLICLAVSQTADPTGSWYRYSYSWPSSYMPDYPKLGLWPDGYYLTVNQFTQAGNWVSGGVAAFERSKMLTGAAAQTIYYNLASTYGGMLPADWEGSTPPPSGAPIPFAEWDDSASIGPNDALRIWNFHVDWTTPANSYFGSALAPNQTLVTANVDPTLCAASPACIDQPGTTVMLDDLADRLMHRLQYRNFGGYQTLVGNHTVDTNSPAGRAGIHWFELRNTGSAWAINQQGTYGPADTTSTSRWMGSIAMDGSGNMALGYSVTDNVSLYPSIRYAGRLATDTLGVLPQTETTLVTGGGYQNDSANRWGDYSAMQVDPADDCTFWYTQEYAKTSGAYNWYTRIGSFKFPSCGTPDFTLDATPATQNVCTGANAAYTVNLTSVSGFNSAVTLSASGVPAGASASFSPNPVTPTGSSTLTLATGAAAAGSYTIGVTGTSGALSHSANVTLNISTALGAAPTLTAPADGSTGIATTPTFTWSAVTGATSYDIQVASDPAFTTIVASATGLTTTSYTPGSPLAAATAYYWRVRAVNGCGAGAYAPVAAFVTSGGGTNTFCVSPNLAIPDGNTTGVTSSQAVATSGLITDLNVSVQATHTWVGDLVFTVQNAGTSTSVTIVDRPGVPATTYGCSGDNIAATLDDEAASPVENQCATSTPAISGTFSPNNPLTAFDGQQLAATWNLNASDRASGDTGTLTQWCLIATYGNAFTADYSDLASSYGVAWHTGTGTGAVRLGAAGDWDTDTTFAAGSDDSTDNGVVRTAFTATTGGVNLTVTGATGYVTGWFDWNQDGDFSDAGEQVFTNQAVSAGSTVPVSFNTGTSVYGKTINARFRVYASMQTLAPDAAPAPFGGAADGEVEDYTWTFSPLAVDLASFTVATTDAGVTLTWETVSETDNTGFNVYRSGSEAGSWTRVNEMLIPALTPGSAQGNVYTWTDATTLAAGTTWYMLEDVDVNGSTTQHEPVSVTVTEPNAVGLAAFGAAAGTAMPALMALGALALAALAGVAARKRRQ